MRLGKRWHYDVSQGEKFELLESVAMAASINRREPFPREKRLSSIVRLLDARDRARARVREIIRTLTSRADRARRGSQKPTVESSEQEMMRASEYLEICQENALDAYTVEDALYWHNEIITELSVELNSIESTSWPGNVKASMSAVLEDRLNHHAEAVTRLAAVLAKNDSLTWGRSA